MDNPYQAPSTDLETPRIGAASPSALASRRARLVAAMVDGILAVAFGMAFSIGVLGKRLFTRPPPTYTLPEMAASAAAGVAFYLLVHGVLLHRRGQSVGKWLVGIRIADVGGGRVPFGRIVGLRLVPVWLVSSMPYAGGILPLIDVLFIFGRQRRCVHDLIARTIVTKAPRAAASVDEQLPA